MSSQQVRCAFYIRSSTQDQTPENQLPDLVKLAKDRGYEVVGTYCEKISATALRRPELERMKQDAMKRRFDVICVYELSRLSRSIRDLHSTIMLLDGLGVQVVSSSQPMLDTSNNALRHLLLSIFGFCAELERQQISERTKQGLQAARRRGAQIGRPRVFVDVEAARKMQRQGQSLAKIAKTMNVGKSTLHRALRQDELLRSA